MTPKGAAQQTKPAARASATRLAPVLLAGVEVFVLIFLNVFPVFLPSGTSGSLLLPRPGTSPFPDGVSKMSFWAAAAGRRVHADGNLAESSADFPLRAHAEPRPARVIFYDLVGTLLPPPPSASSAGLTATGTNHTADDLDLAEHLLRVRQKLNAVPVGLPMSLPTGQNLAALTRRLQAVFGGQLYSLLGDAELGIPPVVGGFGPEEGFFRVQLRGRPSAEVEEQMRNKTNLAARYDRVRGRDPWRAKSIRDQTDPVSKLPFTYAWLGGGGGEEFVWNATAVTNLFGQNALYVSGNSLLADKAARGGWAERAVWVRSGPRPGRLGPEDEKLIEAVAADLTAGTTCPYTPTEEPRWEEFLCCADGCRQMECCFQEVEKELQEAEKKLEETKLEQSMPILV